MNDHPPYSDSNPDSDTGPGSELAPGTPRWVRVFGIITAAVILLFLVLMFTRGPGGHHGPGRHFQSGAPAGQTPRQTGSQ